MKRAILIIMLVCIAITLCSCGLEDKYPHVKLMRSTWRFDNIILPIRDDYQFAENIYNTTDTDSGYDIIIHLEKTK